MLYDRHWTAFRWLILTACSAYYADHSVLWVKSNRVIPTAWNLAASGPPGVGPGTHLSASFRGNRKARKLLLVEMLLATEALGARPAPKGTFCHRNNIAAAAAAAAAAEGGRERGRNIIFSVR